MIESWNSFLEEIKTYIDKESFGTWFQFIKPFSLKDNVLVIEVPNKFHSDWLKKNFISTIQDAASTVFNKKLSIDFKIGADLIEEVKTKDSPPSISISKKKSLYSSPNPKYTFNNFVVGAGNQFVHAASLAVAKRPSKSYNPLLLYGGVGLGKTHLLNAIGNFILSKNSDMKVFYVSSEYFVNDLINSLQHKKMTGFRNKYRNLDVLLVDDIQFIAGKDRTQVEFFHTFNTLYESHKQIIISSDRVPKEMIGLEERLRSRFEWGLIADIQPPDLETRVAILKQKAAENNFDLPPDVALFMGSKIKSNVRELEGCLARVCAFSSLTGKEITLDIAKEILKDLIDSIEKPINIKIIQESVADYFNLRISDIKSKKRERRIVVPRQIAMYLCRRLTNISLPEIGKNFGGRDHTTVLHSDSKIHSIVTKDTGSDIYKALVKITNTLNCDLMC